MPRIDPIQLLNCLSVLLSPNGGIKSTDEVQRIAHLMGKFSKKLVSKCIYIQILKCTQTELLGLFMVSGGWNLIHMWLTECIITKNWPLVRELLELLLLCPVDVERLKTNNCPKLVKELSKDESRYDISALASKLVELWLKSVKGENVVPVKITDIQQIIADAKLKTISENNAVGSDETDNKIEKSNMDAKPIKIEKSDFENKDQSVKVENMKSENEIEPTDANIETKSNIKDQEPEALPIFKISVKDGKQVISQVEDAESKTDKNLEREKKDKHKSNKEKTEKTSSSKSSSSSKHSSKSHSSSSDKSRSSHRSGSSSSSSSKDKDRHKDKDKHSSHKSRSDSSSKSEEKSKSSSKSRDDKNSSRSEKDKSKDKSSKDAKNKDVSAKTSKNDDKPVSPSIHKLGKIPKLSDAKKEKPSISIEVRKPDEPKPKTVKTFHSKFRKHGLEEEVKPPPSRAALLNKKTPPVIPPTLPVAKRPSPVHNESPPEKKPKTVETIEKPGAIKLIPPKPKRVQYLQISVLVSSSTVTNSVSCNIISAMLLLESDMFMDALNASATNKKEPKKRKRRTSGSKDGNTTGDGSPPHTPTTITSPTSEKSVPPRFYQDTLEVEDKDGKDKSNKKVIETANEKETPEPMETEPHTLTINGLKGVLCYHKRKGPKKSIKWKPDNELEQIEYFELDETERVNVTKTFTDMKHLERIHEREAFQKARNLINDDVMEEKTSWKPLLLVDGGGQIQVEHGKNSKEKEIQAIRQKGTLQPLYFHKSMIPDSPLEPEPETHSYTEPTTIPLDDVTGNQDNISDFRNMPWPEPKGNAPPTSSSNINLPTMFPPNMPQFPPGFPNAPFTGVPGFQAPALISGEWPNGVPPMMANGMPGPIPTGIPPGALPNNLPPGMMVPPENMMMNPEMFVGPNAMFPVPDGFNMQNMFPMDFNMAGPQGPPGPDSFPSSGNFRGVIRGRGSSGNWRGKGGGNWETQQRGRGGNTRGGRKAVCIYFQRKGSCRQGDNCSFLHPGVNCPY